MTPLLPSARAPDRAQHAQEARAAERDRRLENQARVLEERVRLLSRIVRSLVEEVPDRTDQQAGLADLDRLNRPGG